jgi:hypothetical protein
MLAVIGKISSSVYKVRTCSVTLFCVIDYTQGVPVDINDILALQNKLNKILHIIIVNYHAAYSQITDFTVVQLNCR